MRLFAYPAALVLAFVVYCACPKLAAFVRSFPKKLLTLLAPLDKKANRPIAFPLCLLLFFATGLLLSLIHPMVSAVVMALPLTGLSPIPSSGAVKRELDSGAFSRDIPTYEKKVRDTCSGLAPEFVGYVCAPLLLMALGMPFYLGGALGWTYSAWCSVRPGDKIQGHIVRASDKVLSVLFVLCSGIAGRSPFHVGGHGAQNRLMDILGIAEDDSATHAPVSGDISQAVFLCCFCICLLCVLLTLLLFPFTL